MIFSHKFSILQLFIVGIVRTISERFVTMRMAIRSGIRTYVHMYICISRGWPETIENITKKLKSAGLSIKTKSTGENAFNAQYGQPIQLLSCILRTFFSSIGGTNVCTMFIYMYLCTYIYVLEK